MPATADVALGPGVDPPFFRFVRIFRTDGCFRARWGTLHHVAAATALSDRPGPSRVVAAAVGAVTAIFAAVVVLVVALAAAGFAVRWALTFGG